MLWFSESTRKRGKKILTKIHVVIKTLQSSPSSTETLLDLISPSTRGPGMGQLSPDDSDYCLKNFWSLNTPDSSWKDPFKLDQSELGRQLEAKNVKLNHLLGYPWSLYSVVPCSLRFFLIPLLKIANPSLFSVPCFIFLHHILHSLCFFCIVSVSPTRA